MVGQTGGSCSPHPSGAPLPSHFQASHAAAVHSCPHSGCGPRRSGPDQLRHQLSGSGWVQCSREFVSSLGAALHCAPPHAEVLSLEPKKVPNLGALTADVYCPPPEAGVSLQSFLHGFADSLSFLCPHDHLPCVCVLILLQGCSCTLGLST